MIKLKQVKDITQIPDKLKELTYQFNLGDIEISENTVEIIQLSMKNHSSIRDLIKKGIKATSSFCSFGADLLAGIV